MIFYKCLCSCSSQSWPVLSFMNPNLTSCNIKVHMFGFPSCTPRPLSCIYISMSEETPQWTTCLTSGQSIPIPNAIVHIMTHKGESTLQKDFTIECFTLSSVALIYMSTSLYRERLGAPTGSVNSSCKFR